MRNSWEWLLKWLYQGKNTELCIIYGRLSFSCSSVHVFSNAKLFCMSREYILYINKNPQFRGGERAPDSAFPKPTTGAVLVTKDGRVLGMGRSDYMRDSVQATIENSGLKATPLKEWCVDWVSDAKFRDDLASSTLYVTLEPSPIGKGEDMPPITKLIEQAGIPNVVIGCPYPVAELAYKGAIALHKAGLSVRVLQSTDALNQECFSLIPEYTALANSKVSCMGCLSQGKKLVQ